METTIYTEQGFLDRKDYLLSLALDSGLPFKTVTDLADLLGENEDFDGLVSALYEYFEAPLFDIYEY